MATFNCNASMAMQRPEILLRHNRHAHPHFLNWKGPHNFFFLPHLAVKDWAFKLKKLYYCDKLSKILMK